MATPLQIEDDRLPEPRGGVLTSRARPRPAGLSPSPAYNTGVALRGAGLLMNAIGARALDTLKRPGQAVAGTLQEVGRGFVGAPRVAERPTPSAAGTTPAAPTPSLASAIPAAQAAPQPAGPSTATGINLIEASNPASMRATPPSAGAPVARRPSATAEDPVIGRFNGRDITRSEADRLAGQLPAARGAVVAGPNGGVAYTPASGETPVPTLAGASPAAAPIAARPAVADPFVGRQLDLNRDARRRALSDIDDQLFRARMHSNSRGGRNLIAQLIAAKAGIIDGGERIDSGLAAGDRDAINGTETAAMQERGLNARDAARLASEAGLEQVRQAGATERTRIAQRPERIISADGTIGMVGDDGAFKPITGPDGKPVRAPLSRDSGAVTPAIEFRSLNDRLTALQQFGRPPGDAGDEYDREVTRIQARMAQLTGAGRAEAGGEAPPIPGARRAPDGNWYVENDDGSFSLVTP